MRLWKAYAVASAAFSALALVIWLAWPTAAAVRPVHRATTPPECVNAQVVDNSGNGPTMYVKWCGTGANGEPPMDATTFVIVDGGPLTPAACPKANPCVVQWPGSPPS